MKVLILGVASVQMDAVLELKRLGHEVYTAAMSKDGPAADEADHFVEINILDESSLEKYIVENQIEAVYSTGSDLAMPVTCRLSEKLDLPHFVSSRVATICNRKNEMRESLSNDFRGNVPFIVLDEITSFDFDFPAVMKPTDSQGQRGIVLIKSQADLKSNFERVKSYSREGKVIIEKYIDGPEVSVNCYMIDGSLAYTVVSDRETWPEYTGLIHKHIVPSITVSDKAKRNIVSVVEEACNQIGIMNGPVYFQIKVMDDEPYIIEMTPRLDGCHMWSILEKATGVNLMRLTLMHLLHNDFSELSNQKDEITPMELVFWCQKPNSIMNQEHLQEPKDSICRFYYYQDGETIRPVNGRFEKIGYYIRNI